MILPFHLNEINDVAKKLLEKFPGKKCFAFFAEMGSGKTTLINAMCRQLGVTENTSSPTFSIINEYRTNDGTKVFHTDWYRLKNAEDAIQSGIEDMLLQKDAWCFIEWPEIAEELLPAETVKLKIKMTGEQERTITVF